jgi:predicted transcriptional regulator of viral defense system
MTAPKLAETIRQGLSKRESLLLTTLAGRGKKTFTLQDIVAELGSSHSSAKELAKSLARKKWIIKIRRGIYLIVPLSAGTDSKYTEHEFLIASRLISPYYIGYWSALNFYNMTEQTPLTVFVATTKRPEGRRSRIILDTNYRFITVNKKKFFGFSPVSIGTDTVNISDREKAIADALDHPEYCGGIAEVAKCLWNTRESISIQKIVNYARKMGNMTIIKRLGFLLDALDIKTEEVYPRMRNMISSGMSILDPTVRQRGSYNTKWKLIVNVSVESLTRWREEY